MKNNIFKVITAAGTGTGFYLKDRNIVVTNYHVVQGNREVALQDQKKNRLLTKVVQVNTEADLAFLKVDLPHQPEKQIILNPELVVRATEKVYIHGYPFGLPYTVTEGIISSPRQMMNQRYYVQTDAAVNPGNSGGPMLNASGELIGVTTSKFTEADNVGFGITCSDLLNELTSLDAENDTYKVKCNSCGFLLEEQTEYCPNCGNTIDQQVFTPVELSHFARFVEEGLHEIGMNPVLARLGRDSWEFYQNSALVRIFVYNNNYLVATSPMNKLPNRNLSELYQYILSRPVYPHMLGVYKNHIYLSYRTHLSDIFSGKASEIKKYIAEMALKADELDNFFVSQFGCELSAESNDALEE